MKGEEVLFLVQRTLAVESVCIAEGILILHFPFEPRRPEIDGADRLLLPLGVVHLFEFEVVLDVVLAFLVREDLEVAQLPDLLCFSFRNPGIAFLFLLRGSFPAVVGLRLDTVLDPVQPVIQNCAMS